MSDQWTTGKRDNHGVLCDAVFDGKGGGWRVRPVVWRETNPRHWIEARAASDRTVFVEGGELEEMAHAPCLQHTAEFFGEWEVVP